MVRVLVPVLVRVAPVFPGNDAADFLLLGLVERTLERLLLRTGSQNLRGRNILRRQVTMPSTPTTRHSQPWFLAETSSNGLHRQSSSSWLLNGLS